MTASIYPAGQIKRRRRTRAQLEQLDAQILEVINEDHPQSVRHLYYRMTDPRLPEHVEKTDAGYDQVWYRVRELRRNGRLPYGWITDASRYGYLVNTFDDAADFLRRVSSLYRSSPWAQSDVYVEVWTESRSIAAVIQEDCEELAVPLYPAGGFTSISLAYQSAEHINAKSRGRPVRILYVGDYDPAGVLIDVALERELRQHLDDSIDFEVIRLGITAQQVAQFDLPKKQRKTGDRRSLHVEWTVEAEAMPARMMRQLVCDAIVEFLPSGALHGARVAEESERKFIRGLAAAVAEERQ
jgi:hypothetical protein